MGDFLRLMACVSRVQHDCLQTHPPVPEPTAEQCQQSRTFAMPILSAVSWPRDPVWRTHLRRISEAVIPQANAVLQTHLKQMEKKPLAELERWADLILAANYTQAGEALVFLPFVAAALQVLWTHMALAPHLQPLPRQENPSLCPCCGSLPVAGLIRAGESGGGLRYLHCSLCNTAWNRVRIHCLSCGSNEHLTYQAMAQENGEGVFDWVKAECCPQCHGYTKLIYQEQAPQADPVADDVATLLLDMLVSDSGWSRLGLNPLYIPDLASANA